MSLLTCQNITVAYAQREIFRNVTFSVEKGDKIGLIGANGCGKTTLFNTLTGQVQPLEGGIFCASGMSIGTVAQHSLAGSRKTVYEELLSVFEPLMELERQMEENDRKVFLTDGKTPEYLERQAFLRESYQANGGLTYVARTHAALSGLGFTKEEELLPVSDLSGGQRTKLSLGKLLLSAPDIMLLDEPTNHLDVKSVEWLEDFLSKQTGARIVISHDRYFLDRVTEKTMELRGGKLYTGKGSYTAYKKNRALQLESDRREYEKGMTEIRRIEKMIEQQKQFNQERNYITIASKEKQIERIRAALPELPPPERGFKLRFGEVTRTGDTVLYVEKLSKAYGEKRLFSDAGFTLSRGDRAFLLGPNGCGKSTLLSVIMHRTQPDAGLCRFGVGVKVGYFEQTQRELMEDKSILQALYDRFPRLTLPELRSRLGAFYFRNDDVEKRMCDLSGGERARVALLILILQAPNFLIMDEPTNHLDVSSREVLEQALAEYEGTLLCVSHDRYFVNRLATRIYSFDGDVIRETAGGYDAYLEAQRQPAAAASASGAPKKTNAYLQRKEAERAERKRLSRIERIEELLSTLSAEKEKITETLGDPEVSADYEKVLEYTGRLSAIAEEQQTLEDEWLTLSAD